MEPLDFIFTLINLFLSPILIAGFLRFCLMIFRGSVLLTLWCWLLGLIFRAFCCVNYLVFHDDGIFILSNCLFICHINIFICWCKYWL